MQNLPGFALADNLNMPIPGDKPQGFELKTATFNSSIMKGKATQENSTVTSMSLFPSLSPTFSLNNLY